MNNAPLRPVISAVGTATYNLSKYLAKVLNPLVGQNGYVLRNTLHFLENVKERTVEPDMVMVNFDVKALYTSLPIDKTLKIVRTKF